MRLRNPRLLFYAVNGLGLGHVTRLLAIARKVRDALPDAEIVFLTSSEAEDVLYREGFAAFKVPSKTIRAEARLRSATYARMLQTVALNLLASFHPHVLVVDTFPAGAIQELLPVLRWESRRVFVYRAQRPEVASSPLMQNTLTLYDLAILPHAEGELAPEDAPMPEGLERLWTGPILIRDRTETKSREEARRLLGLPAEGPILYVTFGGGGETEIDSALAASIEALTQHKSLHLAVANAPLYRDRGGLLSALRSPCVTPVNHYPMAELFPAFDAALSAVGYNTAMELLHHGIPAAYFPLPRQVDDQEARARQIDAAGAGICLPSLEANSLGAAIDRLFDPAQAAEMRLAAHNLVPDSGAGRAAEAIVRLLGL